MPVRRKRRRTADAAYEESHPTLAARLTPEEASAVGAAGGLAALVRSHLAGGCVTRAQAAAMAAEAADKARVAAEEASVAEADKMLDKVLSWEEYGRQADAAIKALQANTVLRTGSDW